MALCAYDTAVADTTFDPTAAAKFMWQRHKALSIALAPQEFTDVMPPEVGEQIYPTALYKMGAFVGGSFAIDARLENSLGHLLYAAAGAKQASASAAGYSGGTIFKPAVDTTSLPWLALRRYVPVE